MTDNEIELARGIIAQARWKQTSSPQYRDCPHSYIIAHRCGPEWKQLADLITMYGEYRMWRKYRFKYLFLDGEIFWVDFPALNRAPEASLDNGGWPRKATLFAI